MLPWQMPEKSKTHTVFLLCLYWVSFVLVSRTQTSQMKWCCTFSNPIICTKPVLHNICRGSVISPESQLHVTPWPRRPHTQTHTHTLIFWPYQSFGRPRCESVRKSECSKQGGLCNEGWSGRGYGMAVTRWQTHTYTHNTHTHTGLSWRPDHGFNYCISHTCKVFWGSGVE